MLLRKSMVARHLLIKVKIKSDFYTKKVNFYNCKPLFYWFL